MKKWFFVLICLPFVFGACKKDKGTGCTAVQTTQVATTPEIDSIQNFLNHNGITAIKHECGAFYTIDSVGSRVSPGICSSVAVTYTGYLMGQTTSFQEYTDSAGVVFSMQDVVIGWQRVLPELKEGGKITIYIPPSLGYGATDKKNPDGDIIVPRNSYMKFNISLLQVY
ncbi:MAG: FKBP-type peptidyl-prolyl cis-trans isomerase [Ferruginibacter sp.]